MKTVEEIVKEKEYFELSASERALIEDLAGNQEEYDQLRHLMVETSNFYKEKEVVASDRMHDHVMEKLYPPTTSSVKWYQSILLFLFPKNKSFVQYPAFQLAGILLIFGVVFSLWKTPFKEEDLAQNVQIENPEPQKQQSIDHLQNERDNLVEDQKVMIPDFNAEPLEEEIPTPTVKNEETGIEPDLEVVEETVWEDFQDEEVNMSNVAKDAELPVLNPAPAVVGEMNDVTYNRLYREGRDKNAESGEKVTTTSVTNQVNSLSLDEVAVGKNKKYAELEKRDTYKERKEKSNYSVTEIPGLLELFFEVKKQYH